MVKALVVLGIIVPTSDLLPVRRSIAYFLDNFERQTQEQETIGVRAKPQFLNLTLFVVNLGRRSAQFVVLDSMSAARVQRSLEGRERGGLPEMLTLALAALPMSTGFVA